MISLWQNSKVWVSTEIFLDFNRTYVPWRNSWRQPTWICCQVFALNSNLSKDCSNRLDICLSCTKLNFWNYFHWKQPWTTLCWKKSTEEEKGGQCWQKFFNFCSNSDRTLQVSESRADLQRGREEVEHEGISEEEGTRRHQVCIHYSN